MPRHPDSATDAESQAGGVPDFDTLVLRYKDRVYNVLYRCLGNHEDALDVAQEVFLRAYRGIESFRGESAAYTWLYRIAVNLARNRLRDRGRKGRDRSYSLEAIEEAAPGEAQALGAVTETPRTAAERGELDRALHACLEELPEVYRTAFVLRLMDNLRYDEIAEAVECPAGTVKSRISQARHLLRQCLEASGTM